MKTLIITAIFTIALSQSGSTKTVNRWLDRPLFNYNVQRNRLPFGDYIFIRSYRKVTQILISSDYSLLTIYTDRNNRKHGYIKSSSFQRIGSTVVKPHKINQWEFNQLLETCLTKGDMRPYSSSKYCGPLEIFKSRNRSKTYITEQNGEYTVRYRGSEFPQSDIRLGGMDKYLSVKRLKDGKGKHNPYYEIFIRESHDPIIKKIIIKILKEIKKSTKRQPPAKKLQK